MKKNFSIKLTFTLLLVFFINFSVNGQPGCPFVEAGNNVTVNCNSPCTTLTATGLTTGATTTYTVSSIPYNPPYPYNTGTPILVNIDDRWSNVINLPFTFCFYGNNYTQIICGSNGVIGFNTSYANGYCPWSFSVSCPHPNILNGCTGPYILGPYHDIDPAVSGNMYYAILGSYPCRTFVVSWYQVAMYSSSCNYMKATHQIVLYESTNVVEVYIQNKPVCSSWNGGRAVIGIQNADGTQGITPPNRNTGTWTAQNEAWRFTPSGTPNYTLSWWQGNTQIATGPSVNVCPTTNTTYTAQIVYDLCTGNTLTLTDNVTVTVNNTTTVTVNPTSAAICQGNSTTLTASGGTSYSWAPATGLNTTTGPTVVASPTTTTTYTLTGISSNGCTSTIPITVTVNPNPTPTVSPPTPGICPGGSIQLTANGASSYTWSPATGLSCTACPNPTANPPWTTTYTVTGTSSEGCTGQGTVTVTVNPIPTVSVTPASTSICTGTSTTLTASGASTYSWAPATGLSCTNCPNPTASPTSQTTYTVTGTSSAGCTNSATATVSINPDLVLGVTPSNPYICVGNSVQLTANGANSYTWTPSNTLSCSNCPNPIANPTSQTTYTVTGTATNGCTGQTTVTVNMHPNPVITISPNTPVICLGESVNLTASGAVQYNWAPATGLSSTTGTSVSASPSQNTTYTITGTSANGCTASTTVSLTVNPIPTSNFTVSAPNCINNTATVTYTGSAASGASYNWNFSGGNANPGTGQGPHSVTWSSPGTYNISLTVTENNCTSPATTQSVVVGNIRTNPDTHTNVICFGESNGTATVYPVDGIAPYSYHWNTSPPQNTQTATNLPVGTYYVTITDAQGCQTFDTVTVSQPEKLTINISHENEGCANSCDGSINVSVTGGISPYQYSWSGSSVQTPNRINLCTGSYTVTVKDANNCTISGSATIITNSPIDALAIVDSRTVLIPGTITFYFTGSGANSYYWDFGDGTNSTLMNPSHQYTEEGEYTVKLVANSGAPDFCKDSFYIVITVVLPSEIDIPNFFSPNGDEYNETFYVKSKGLKEENMQIFNRWGKKIYEWNTLGGRWDGRSFNGAEEAEGTYYYIYTAKGLDGKEFRRTGTVTLLR